MKITKKELVRIIKEEVNKVRVKGPVSQKRLVPDFPKDIPSSDVATGVVELYKSVDAISTSIMEMSARIDGIEKVTKELSGDVKHNRKYTSFLANQATNPRIDPDDPMFEVLSGQIEGLYEMFGQMLDAFPEDLVAAIDAQMKDSEEEEGEE
jgi:hypothetical protein